MLSLVFLKKVTRGCFLFKPRLFKNLQILTQLDTNDKDTALAKNHTARFSTNLHSDHPRVFTSSHYQMGNEEVKNFLQAKNIKHQETSEQVILQECPFCKKPTNGKSSNMWKLSINKIRGVWHCFRCQKSGNWFEFKALLGNFNPQQAISPPSVRPALPPGALKAGRGCSLPSQDEARMYSVNLMYGKEYASVRRYLQEERQLNTTVLHEYGVGAAKFYFRPELGKKYQTLDCVTFPWMMQKCELSEEEQRQFPKLKPKDVVFRRVKARAICNKGLQRLDPTGGGWGLFGWHTILDTDTELVITEGEYDAMAVRQATGMRAVSLPNGCSSLPMDLVYILERFEKIYLWMDNDGPGQEGCAKFAKKLGIGRVYIVKPLPDDINPPKDANEALKYKTKEYITNMIEAACPLPNMDIVRFSDLRQDVFYKLTNPEKFEGVPIKSFPTLNRILKGFRKGELSVFTGPTGSGKTTLLSQLSLDMAESGVSTLWGSFEVKNTILIEKMLRQFTKGTVDLDVLKGRAGESSDNHRRHVEEKVVNIFDQFEQLPLHFLKFHGGTELEKVIDAMDYAVDLLDVQHILLDNLQFMIPYTPSFTSGYDNIFTRQDFAIESFRKFATEKNVHVTLVIHPKKEEDGHRLGISSVFGTAKATQEADAIVILQKEREGKFLEVKKNRYDGDLGRIPLKFSKFTSSLQESTDQSLNINGSYKF